MRRGPLLRPIVACASEPGDLVLDPVSGSGTTGMASLDLGRRYLGSLGPSGRTYGTPSSR